MKTPDRLNLVKETPLYALTKTAIKLGEIGRLFIKRDDLTGLEFSGNKIRKLQYIAADALQKGHDTLVTEGTWQSNHCRATAALCARFGLHCMLLIRPRTFVPPQGNLFLNLLFGAETREFPRPDFDTNRTSIVAEVMDDLRSKGRNPRWVPMGASEPLGCWGYIEAARELNEQRQRMQSAHSGAEADLVVAASSCGTLAGLLLGKWLHKLDWLQIHAIPVSDDAAFIAAETRTLCEKTIEEFNLDVTIRDDDMHLIDGYVGPGYAIPYPEVHETIRNVARDEAIILDPVYTGKAFHGMCDQIQKGKLGSDRDVIFLHTGGIFSTFAFTDEILASK
ncbi:MAG: 1-aminocyclopropane-1-carboxylate deaminase/D-cysteine desulfhydrase [Phycisphaerae bacterium]